MVTPDQFFTKNIYERIDPDSLGLLQIIDSYHDFGTKRESKAAIDHFFLEKIGDNADVLRSTVNKKQEEVSKILKDNFGITYSNIEITSEQSYERKLGKEVLYGDPQLGTVLTNVTFSRLYTLTDVEITKLSNECDAIQLIDDPEFEASYNKVVGALDAARKTLGLNFLNWMFHDNKDLRVGTEVGISYDADYDINNLVTGNLNDRSKKFVTKQIITPQNVLDSAGTGLKGIYTSTKGTAHLAIIEPDQASRVDYKSPLTREYSNSFTKDIGTFNIKSKGSGPLDFTWSFELIKAPPSAREPLPASISFDVDEKHKDGPGAKYLAELIACADDACLRSKVAEYASKIDPTGIKTLSDNKAFLAKFFLDVKRMGDHEQANAVKAINLGYKLTNGEVASPSPCIFSTGDRLSSLYSRIIGNPTVFANTYKSTPHDDEPVSYGSAKAFFCYRGIPTKDLTPEQIARKALINTLQQFNYVLTVFIQFNHSGSSFNTLLENIKQHKDTFECVKFSSHASLQLLKTNLIKRKANDIFIHLNTIITVFKDAKASINALFNELQQSAIALGLVTASDNISVTGLNISINDDIDIEIIQGMTTYIESIMRINVGGISLMGLFDKVKGFLKDYKKTHTKILRSGDSIQVFTVPKMLFINENKTESKVDYINFDISEIEDIVTTAQRYFTPRGKITRDSLKKDMESKLSRYYTRLFNDNIEAELSYIVAAINNTPEVDPSADIANNIANALSTVLADALASRAAVGGHIMYQTPLSGTHTNNVKYENTIEGVKARIQEREGIPSDQERLIFKGYSVENDIQSPAKELVSIYKIVTNTMIGFIEKYSEYLILVPGDDGPFPLTGNTTLHEGGTYTKLRRGVYSADYTYWNQADIVESALSMMMSHVKSAIEFGDKRLDNKLEYIWKDLEDQLELKGPVDRPDIRVDNEDIRTEVWYITVSSMSGKIAQILVTKPDDGTFIFQWLQTQANGTTAAVAAQQAKIIDITTIRHDNLIQLVKNVVKRIKEMEEINKRDFTGELSELYTNIELSMNEIKVYTVISPDVLNIITAIHNYIRYTGASQFKKNLYKAIGMVGGKQQKRRTYKKSRRVRRKQTYRRSK